MIAATERFASQAVDSTVLRGFAQIGVGVVLVVVVLAVAAVRRFEFHRETGAAVGRGFVQILAAGSVVGLLLNAHFAWAGVVLAFMIRAVAWISHERGCRSRARSAPRRFRSHSAPAR